MYCGASLRANVVCIIYVWGIAKEGYHSIIVSRGKERRPEHPKCSAIERVWGQTKDCGERVETWFASEGVRKGA
jgi:hypothetical protein